MALNDNGKTFRKSYANSGDKCITCDRKIPEGKLIIKHNITKKIICLICIIGLAEVE